MKSLNLTLLVDAEHHGVDRRLHVKAHDVANFFAELGILRERETLAAMGLQAEGPPDATDARLAHPQLLGQPPGAPMGGVLRDAFQSLGNHPLDALIANRPGSSDPWFIIQGFQAASVETLTPEPQPSSLSCAVALQPSMRRQSNCF